LTLRKWDQAPPIAPSKFEMADSAQIQKSVSMRCPVFLSMYQPLRTALPL
jgi:hypothetical protein